MSLTEVQEEFLTIKCALRGPVDEKCSLKGEKPWVLPDLNPHLQPKPGDPSSAQESTKKSETPSKSKK